MSPKFALRCVATPRPAAFAALLGRCAVPRAALLVAPRAARPPPAPLVSECRTAGARLHELTMNSLFTCCERWQRHVHSGMRPCSNCRPDGTTRTFQPRKCCVDCGFLRMERRKPSVQLVACDALGRIAPGGRHARGRHELRLPRCRLDFCAGMALMLALRLRQTQLLKLR